MLLLLHRFIYIIHSTNYILIFFFLMIRRPPRSTPFPTRRSSDLAGPFLLPMRRRSEAAHLAHGAWPKDPALAARRSDRKSTRLNSSHDQISYAVFCLKKK